MDDKDIGVMFGLLKADLVQMEENLLQELDQIKTRLGNVEEILHLETTRAQMKQKEEEASARRKAEIRKILEREK